MLYKIHTSIHVTFPIFFANKFKNIFNKRRRKEMKNLQFKSLDDCIECYGRENLVAIDTLPQIIFYTANGAQPKFVSENQTKQGKISCWFLKDETSYVYHLWQKANPKKDKSKKE